MYNKSYDCDSIRNNDYDISKYIKQYFHSEYRCLDLGCGNCRKIEALSDLAECYYAIDYNVGRIEDAKKRCSGKNIVLTTGDNFYLPFPNEMFDLVSCFMTKYSISEVSRVLKPEGLFIVETTGADDKREIKKQFGKDSIGWRGRMMYDSTEEQIERLLLSLTPFFDVINHHQICFDTSIKMEELLKLFEMTNDIRGLDLLQDRQIIEQLTDDNGYVSFKEERIIIVAKKR